MTSEHIDIAVLGSGAVGTIFAWRASRYPNARVSVVCRSNFEAVRENGFQMKTARWGDAVFHPAEVIQHSNIPTDRKYDYVICATKFEDPDSFKKTVSQVAHEGTTIVPVHNGFAATDFLCEEFPNNRVLPGICYTACSQPQSGTIQQRAQIKPHAFSIGLKQSPDLTEEDHKSVQTLVDLDSEFALAENIDTEIWSKLVWNAGWNTTTALSGLDSQQMLACSFPCRTQIIRHLAQETFDVGTACGIKIPEYCVEEIISSVEGRPPIVPSMLQDLRSGRPIELESLCGEIWKLGDKLGVPTPTIKSVYHLLNLLLGAMQDEKKSLQGKN